jgi:CubicO group peptidase (beta-lactamase class C family)
MRTFAAHAMVLGLLSLLTIPARAGDDETLPPDSGGPSPALVAYIECQMSQYKIPGTSIAVIKDYQIEWAKGFGLRDVANNLPVTVTTRFQAASTSKPITAIATMITLDQLHLTPAEEVNTIFAKVPPSPEVGAWTLPNPYPTPVTLAMLLAHIGGTNDFRYSGYRYGYYEDPPAPIDPIPTMHEELNGLPPANTPAIEVVRPPGVTWVYSPAGYTVLQAMLMNIYNKPFADIMAKLVIKPFGMPESTFLQPTPNYLTPSIAVPYYPVPVGLPADQVTGNQPLPYGPMVFDTASSGGLTTTPTGLAKVVIAFQKALAGKQQGFLKPETAQAMMVRQPGSVPAGSCFATSNPDLVACHTSWGLGFDVNLTKYFLHEPDGAPTGSYFGHSGFNSGFLTIILGSKTGGYGLVIQENAAPQDMSTDNIPEQQYLLNVVKSIADEEHWQ